MYETERDRQNEQRLMDAIGEAHGLHFVKLPIKYSLDALAFDDGDARGFFEFKSREISAQKFPTAMVNLGKVIAASNLSRATGLNCWLCVEWTDTVGVIDFASPFEIGVGGRTDRDDRNDIDLMAHYPISGFRMLNLY